MHWLLWTLSTTTKVQGSHAAEFDGADDHMELDDAPSLNIRTNDFSISMWINLQTAPSTTWVGLFTKGSGTPSDDGFAFNYHAGFLV